MRDDLGPDGWPALEGGLPRAGRGRRAVWGKTSGTQEEFGWLSRETGFDGGGSRVEYLLALGSEDDLLGHASFWLVRRTACFAIACYPSGVHDAFARAGIEKQFLEWERDGPHAAAALRLLPEVERLGREAASGADARRAEAVEDAAATGEVPTLSERIDEALRAVSSAVTFEQLVALYADVLSKRRPAILGGVREPLPASALAALLLPLDRGNADKLSMAGWIISRSFDAQATRATWDLIVCDQIPPSLRSGAGRAPTETEQSAAKHLADALLAGDPGRLRRRVSAEHSTVSLSPRVSYAAAVSGHAHEQAAAPTATPGSAAAAPAPPRSDPTPQVKALVEFAESSERTWSLPASLFHPTDLSVEDQQRLQKCIWAVWEQLDAAFPDLRDHPARYEERRRHLAWKVERIREAVHALDPRAAAALELDPPGRALKRP